MNLDKLINIVPDKVIKELSDVIGKFHIDNSLRLAHFLGQCSHESGGFSFTAENLNYSYDGLLNVFPKYFTPQKAHDCMRNPMKIANVVYANRMGNGDEASGDGYKHRGFGYLQTTGKKNQQAFFKSIGLPEDSDPVLISTKYPLLSSAFFWSDNNLNVIADLGSDSEIVTKITKKVNGGALGLAHRISEFNKFYSILK